MTGPPQRPGFHFPSAPGSVPPRPAGRPGYRSRPRAHAASTSPPLPGGRGTRRCSGTRPGRSRIGGQRIRQRPVLRQDLLQTRYAALVDIHPEGRQELLISHAVTSSYYKVVVYKAPLQELVLHCWGCCGLVVTTYRLTVPERLQPQPPCRVVNQLDTARRFM